VVSVRQIEKLNVTMFFARNETVFSVRNLSYISLKTGMRLKEKSVKADNSKNIYGRANITGINLGEIYADFE